MTRIGSLCSGYEGLGMAVQEVLGGGLAWVADNDPGAATLLTHHYPSIKNLGDITEVNWGAVEPVERLAGGFPCQDVSQAGIRAGLKHGNRSGIWHEFVKAIAALRPHMVVIENVLGLLTARGDEPTPEHLAAEATRDTLARLSWWQENELDLAIGKRDTQRAREVRARITRLRKLRKRAVDRCQWHEQRLIRAAGTVLADLAVLGYDAEWVVVTASAAGACRRRARLFILAFPSAGRIVGGEPIAVIEDGAWTAPRESLFGALPFTGRIPASGRMAGGLIYAAEAGPTAAGAGLLPTPAAGNFNDGESLGSWETRRQANLAKGINGNGQGTPLAIAAQALLKTPTAQLAVNGGSQHPDKRRAGGHGPTLADQVEHELLPTPTAREKGGSNARHGDATRGDDLPEAVKFLPTPRAADGMTETMETTRARMERGARRRGTLEEAAALLPTPSATDGKGRSAPGGRARIDGRTRGADADLPEAVALLLPTPAARDGKGRDMPGRAGGKSLPETLLPTPAARDWKSGQSNLIGTNSRPLNEVAEMLLPTPSAGNFNDGEDLASWEARRDRNLAKGVNGNGQGTPRPVAAQQLAGGTDWGPYEAAIRRWEAVTGRQAPPPTVPGRTGERFNPALPEWMQGLPAGWITDVPGLSRNAQLKLAGNGVVPQQGALALRILLDRAGISLTGERAA
jgi:DNA (cytosine-5)-methyltransferase 1